jgi:hypothetical protein
LVPLLLEQHDLLEEEHGGMYEACETLTASETDAILEALRQATEVPVHPHNETDNAFKAAKNALVRAGFDRGSWGGIERGLNDPHWHAGLSAGAQSGLRSPRSFTTND